MDRTCHVAFGFYCRYNHTELAESSKSTVVVIQYRVAHNKWNVHVVPRYLPSHGFGNNHRRSLQ